MNDEDELVANAIGAVLSDVARAVDGIVERMGNDNPRAVVHGAFACAGDDRWVAIAAWDDDEAERLAKVTGGDVGAWTATRTPLEAAEMLQASGIEAVPVQDFGDVFADPQLAHREHYIPLSHPFLGDGLYERNGFRLSDAPATYHRASATLGQDNEHVLGDVLGLSTKERQQLADEGALS